MILEFREKLISPFRGKPYLPSKNIRIDEMRYAVIMYIHTSTDNGAKKENKFGAGGFFFLYSIPIPKNIKVAPFLQFEYTKILFSLN